MTFFSPRSLQQFLCTRLPLGLFIFFLRHTSEFMGVFSAVHGPQATFSFLVHLIMCSVNPNPAKYQINKQSNRLKAPLQKNEKNLEPLKILQ